MQVRVNNAFLGSVPLFPGEDTSRITQTDVPVPVVNLRPFSNSLSFDFTFEWLRKQHCDDTTPINMQGSILRDSYLDLRGYQHWAPMPNLEIFANAGFPFTRFADLSETTAVLPLASSAQEIETFLTLMGHFGRQTGFPALRVTVAGPDSLHEGAHTDFLVIGSGDDQPAFDKLGTHLPVAMRSGQLQVHDTQGFFAMLRGHQWWKAESNEHKESGELTAGGTPDAVIEGIQSPYDIAGNRSVVAIHLKDATASRTVHRYVPGRAAVQRHLRQRFRASRNPISVLPTWDCGLSCRRINVVDIRDALVHGEALAGRTHRDRPRVSAGYLDPPMAASEGSDAADNNGRIATAAQS